MQPVFDFLGSAAGVEILRIIDSIGTIVAAILSGAALKNASQVKRALGGVVERTAAEWVRDLFRRKSGPKARASATLEEQPVTLTERIEGLKTTYERNWVMQGILNQEVRKRLDRVDPPRRKATPTDD